MDHDLSTNDTAQGDLRGFVSLIRRQLPLILVVALATGAVTLAVSLTRTERYRATADVLYVDPQSGPSITTDDAERAVATFVELATTEEVLGPVATERGLSTTRLRRDLSVRGDRNANIISFTAIAGTATASAGIANDVAQSLVRWRDGQRERQVGARIEFLRQQLTSLAGRTAPSDVAAAADIRTQLAQALAELAVPSAELTIVSLARVPRAAYTPQPIRDGIIGLLAGTVLGVFFAAIRDRLDRRLRTVEEVEAHYPYPLLGVVPQVSGSAALKHVSDADTHSPLADAYRTVRTNLMLVTLHDRRASARGDVWVVSSAVSAEGKSAAVANLARALAASGSRVLAISADLHQPSLHKYFGVSVAGWQGLTDVLLGDVSLDAAARVVHQPRKVAPQHGHVALLGNEATFTDPVVLYQSPAMGSLIERARELYDAILIDTSPVLATGEASLLSRLADGVIMVARLDHLTKHQATRAARSLATVGVTPLGVLATGYRDAASYAYGYSHRPSDDDSVGGLEEEPPVQQRLAVRGS